VIGAKPAGRDHAVHVGMQGEFLAPGVQDAEEADLRAQVSRVLRQFEEGFGTGTKQQTVEQFSVLQHQGSKVAGESEDDVGVGSGQQFALSGRDPAFPRRGLTLRAVAIAAGNGALSITCLMGSFF